MSSGQATEQVVPPVPLEVTVEEALEVLLPLSESSAPVATVVSLETVAVLVILVPTGVPATTL